MSNNWPQIRCFNYRHQYLKLSAIQPDRPGQSLLELKSQTSDRVQTVWLKFGKTGDHTRAARQQQNANKITTRATKVLYQNNKSITCYISTISNLLSMNGISMIHVRC